jgi:uncharacterized protein YndB with AHSA1/START domain
MAVFTVEYDIDRTFAAPPAEVFAAWTEPERFVQWFGPAELNVPVGRVLLDARPGGDWRVAMIAPDGTTMTLDGVYREVDPPRRLVFTTGDPDNTDGALGSVCWVDLTGTDTTTMHFHQAGVNTPPEHAEGAKAGWEMFFDRLEAYLSPEPA